MGGSVNIAAEYGQMMVAEGIFWGSLLFIFYAYAGYFLLLLALSCFRNRTVLTGDIQPAVSFVITAYNEEARIKEKIENTLQQQYPRERLELVVASDCSSDGTDDCDPFDPLDHSSSAMPSRSTIVAIRTGTP